MLAAGQQAKGTAPAKEKQDAKENQESKEKPESKPLKILVLYKDWASYEDRSRVHAILKGKVTTRFNDESTEEVAVKIPSGEDPTSYVQRLIKEALKDRAVVSARLGPGSTYFLK